MSTKHAPSPGLVHLILSSQVRDDFYLNVPLDIILTLCLHPRKYLRYLGWCVLGVEGNLGDERGVEVALHGQLTDQGVYVYLIPSDKNPLAHAVDVEVINQRSVSSSETTTAPQDFQSKLLERDGCCIWTGPPGIGMHIIPFWRGTEACHNPFKLSLVC